MSNSTNKRLATAIVDALFVNGSSERAQRLVLTVDKPVTRDLGGWSRLAAIDVVKAMLDKHGVAHN